MASYGFQKRLSVFLFAIVALLFTPKSLATENKKSFECYVHTGAPIELLAPDKKSVEQAYVVVGQLPDQASFPCNPDNFTMDGKLKIRMKGHDVFLRLTPQNIGLDFEMIQNDKLPPPKKDEDVKISTAARKVYLDGQVGTTVQMFRDPGKSWYTNKLDEEKRKRGEKAEPNQSVAFLTIEADGEAYLQNNPKLPTNDPSKKRVLLMNESKVIPDFFDPVLKKKISKQFNRIVILPDTPNAEEDYKKGKAQTGTVEGWINADNIRYTPLSPRIEDTATTEKTQAESGCKDCAANNPKTIESQSQEIIKNLKADDPVARAVALLKSQSCLKDLPFKTAVKMTKPKSVNIVKPIIDHLKGLYSRLFKKAHEAPEPPMEPTAEQATTIHLVAQALWSEMRSCAYLGTRYAKSEARILLNRVEFCDRQVDEHEKRVAAAMKEALRRHRKPPKTKPPKCQFVDADAMDHFKPGPSTPEKLAKQLQKVIEHPYAISSFNKDDDNAPKLLCIQGSDTDPSAKIYEDYLAIAAELVLKPNELKKQTKSLGNDTLAYALGGVEKDWMQGMSPVTNARVDGLPVDRVACMRMYRCNNSDCSRKVDE